MKLIYGSKKRIASNEVYYITESDLLIPSKVLAFGETNSLVNSIENQVINGTKISHLFKHSDLSLWWFIHPSIIPSIKSITSFLNIFEEIIERKKPTTIQVIGGFDKLYLIQQVCSKKNIQLEFPKLEYSIFKLRKKVKHTIQNYRFKKITLKKVKLRYNSFRSKNRKIPNINNQILFVIATAYRRDIYDPIRGESKKGEYIQEPIINNFKEMGWDISCIDIDYTFRGNLKVLNERLNESMFWFPLEYVMKTYPSHIDYRVFLNKYWKILKNEDFKSLFKYKEINFWEEIEDDFRKLTFLPHLPSYLQLLDSLTRFFKTNRPKAVFIPYEAGPLALAFIVACRRNKIKTIGIQHGMILSENSDYSHKDFQSSHNPFGMILPDFLLLFGEFSKRNLLKNNYPKEKLIVFGNAAFFEIEKILHTLQSKDLKKKYNIPKNKKIILLLTSKDQDYHHPYEKQNNDQRLLQKLLEIYSNNDDYFVILKPHPGEENIEFYKKIIQKYNATNFVILQGDLFELLSLSDVNVSAFSTALIDSIALAKITLKVDIKGNHFPMPFDEDGVLVRCKLELLGEIIERLLNDVDFQEKFLKQRIFFLKDQYNIPNNMVRDQLEWLLNEKY